MARSYVLTVAAVGLAVATVTVAAMTTSDLDAAVRPLLGLALVLYLLFLMVGSSRWLAVSSAPMVGTIVIEAGLGDDPTWIRSIVLGCMWYLTIEVGWEAIEARAPVRYSADANRGRLQELATVVGLSLAVGFVAAAVASSVAPARSVALQAVVLGGLLVTFVTVLQRSAPEGELRNRE